MDNRIFVSSEIGDLRKVLVHKPDIGIDRISPKRAEELLFDDIVFLEKMQEEHVVFTDTLKMLIGDKNVLESEQMILEALYANPARKQRLIEAIALFEELPDTHKTLLENLENEALVDVLITGYCAATDQILFDPIPNFIFTRDTAVMINDHVVITKPSKMARQRENYLTRFIFWEHPLFKVLQDNQNIINLN